jgi:hypothetical protein
MLDPQKRRDGSAAPFNNDLLDACVADSESSIARNQKKTVLDVLAVDVSSRDCARRVVTTKGSSGTLSGAFAGSRSIERR